MILKRFYEETLAQASYLIGCSATGEALVIDPNRDIEPYLRSAEAEGVRITHVTETHIHADFVSGSRELSERTGAALYLSDEGDANWKYGYADRAGAVLVRDGDSFSVGNVRIDVLHTPGHTPEHLSFLVTDTAAADKPIGVVTGDFVFVGDVGRPDLLEKAANVQGSMDAAARTLFHSLQRFKLQPDYLQIWPGHGAGSACGKGMSAVPHSTVGYERMFNWALCCENEDEFVDAVLAGQPEPPKYFGAMKRINKEGPRVLGGFCRPPRLPAERLTELLDRGALIVDTRPAADYAAAFVPGTLNLPLNRSFNTWAGWLMPHDQDCYLIIDERREGAVNAAIRDLAMIGLDRVAGYFGADAVEAWAVSGGVLEAIPQMSVRELEHQSRDGDVTLVDVRGRTEWDAGHLPGARHIPLGHLTDRLDEIPMDKPVILQCQGGARSAIGASLLKMKGVPNVINLTGGYAAWQAAGNPVEHPSKTEQPASSS